MLHHRDLLDGPNLSVPCLDHGFVRLVDMMPRLVPDGVMTADFAVVQAARVSYDQGLKGAAEDRNTLRYMYRNMHTTPFEMIEWKFHCAMPIFVARQWIRHRTANVNEMSGRYTKLPDVFYRPGTDEIRQQSKTNKQGSEGPVDAVFADKFLQVLDQQCQTAYNEYVAAIEAGIGNEQARMLLPVNIYTQWYWKIDLHNLLHFLALRCDHHAQAETRTFAEAILALISPLVPWSVEAWNDYHHYRSAIRLTALEVAAVGKPICYDSKLGLVVPQITSENKREREEWVVKAKRLGMTVQG